MHDQDTVFIAIAISGGDIKLVKDVFTKEEDARKYVERNKEVCLNHQGLTLVYIERVLNPKENELDGVRWD